jgi:[glutamine synthetase] adenylyltransferase / [glutamine synthetase]-adenylyl-L-tyrosine phosphorylase
MCSHTTHPSAEATLEHILPFSRYVQRLLGSEPHLRAYLLENLQRPFLREEMHAFMKAACAGTTLDETCLHSLLRKLRKRVILRLATRDLAGMADLAEVMTTMTDLAELAICFALEHHQKWMTHPSQFGSPIGEKSAVSQQLLVVAMGKLGGGELNVSSDVDLIFIYPEDGETNGKKRSPIMTSSLVWDAS